MLTYNFEHGVSSADSVGYRFAGVELDCERGTLRVDGEAVSAGALPLNLLRIVCEARGKLIPRQRLFDQLWPRQEISDEALTKLIGRTRDLLRAHGTGLVTVRGQGLRLDAEVLPLSDAQVRLLRAAPSPSAHNAADDPTPHNLPRIAVLMVCGFIVAAVIAAFFVRKNVMLAQPVLAGLAVLPDDVQASRPDTLRLLQLAETAWDEADTDRAVKLLIGIQADDPASAIAPIALAMLDSANPRQHWATIAQQRVGASSTAYVRLLANYVQAASGADDGRAALDAVLAVREGAWRLQLRRAHIDIARHEIPSALAALRRIPLRGPPASVIYRALEGRAAFGDQAAVSAALADGILSDAPAQRAVIEANLLEQQGQADAAIARLDAAARIARGQNAFSLAASAHEVAALYSFAASRPDTQTRLIAAANQLIDDNYWLYVAEVEMLGAEEASRNADATLARRLLMSAKSHVRQTTQPLNLEMLNARLKLFEPDTFATSEQLDSTEFSSGEGNLVRAWLAFAAHDSAAARALLERSRKEGVAETYFADSADLLAGSLGDHVANCAFRLPYPNYLRFSACRAIAEINSKRSG